MTTQSSLVYGEDVALGRAVYQTKCMSCHGEKGEGVEGEYDEALHGDASVGELAEVIADAMPPDDASTCTGDEASSVAAYIHQAFYSPAARMRNRTPRLQLARLTGDQLRQSMTDVYAHFAGQADSAPGSGLQGQYFNGTRRRRDDQKIERVDSVIEFDFGHDGPGEGINGKDFSVQWTGGVKVDTTGRHELVIRSTCAFMCYFGTYDHEFINNHVQSGDKTEFRQTLSLTAGRTYPIKIDFYQRERKTEQPPAKFSLSWVAPGRTEQLIPARNLVPDRVPANFALQTKLPPDDGSYGYERGIRVDRQWDESTTAAAIEFARVAVDELWPRYQQRRRDDQDQGRDQLRRFLTEFVETAFRGPCDEDIQHMYVDAHLETTSDDTEAIKRTVLLAFKSPRFLYPALDFDRTASQRAANRLTLTLFDSAPCDHWLLEQIEQNQLETPEQVRAAAERLLADDRARAKIRSLMYGWMDLQSTEEIAKDPESFAGFSPEIVSDLRDSFDRFLDEVIWSETSDLRQLFQADWTYTTDRLASYYGEGWQPAEEAGPRLRHSVADPRRAGVLTHPLLMSDLAYTDTGSPVHRGVFLIRHMLGRTLRPPEAAITPLNPNLHPDLTTRERVTLQTRGETCQMCHVKINALGFTLENFDAVGRYRTEEHGKPVDTTGFYNTRSGDLVELTGPTELATFLADNQDSHQAFVEHVFEYLVKQPVAAYGLDRLAALTESFRASGYNMRKLFVDIAVIASTEQWDAHLAQNTSN